MVDFFVERADFSLNPAQILAAARSRACPCRPAALGAKVGGFGSTGSAGAEARTTYTTGAADTGTTRATLTARPAARALGAGRLGFSIRRGTVPALGAVRRLGVCKIR